MRRLALTFLLLPFLSLGACLLADENKTGKADSIGVAEMAPDGTISLRLRAESDIHGSHLIGDGVLVYKKDNPDYKMILNHLGGMHPGESKSVAPWPDKKDDPPPK